MVVILVHWLIKKDMVDDFENAWTKMKVGKSSGLHKEILTTPEEYQDDDMYHTFSIGNPFYTTYLNIGIWESLDHFDNAIKKYIFKPEVSKDDNGDIVLIQRVKPYEFKIRERVVMRIVNERGDSLW